MKYILLRIEDDEEAQRLVEDAAEYPDSPILTPCQEHMVHAEILSVRDNLGEPVPEEDRGLTAADPEPPIGWRRYHPLLWLRCQRCDLVAKYCPCDMPRLTQEAWREVRKWIAFPAAGDGALETYDEVSAHRLDRTGTVVVGTLMPYDATQGERVRDHEGVVWCVVADSVRKIPRPANGEPTDG